MSRNFLPLFLRDNFQTQLRRAFDRANNTKGFRRTIKRFSLVGITIGVGTLIVVMSIMNGFREELLKSILGINGHMDIYSSAMRHFNPDDEIYSRLKKIDNVKYAYPMLEKQAIATNQSETVGLRVYGINNKDLRNKAVISSNIKSGSINDFQGKTIIIGSRLAQKMRINLGQTIKLLSPQFSQTAFGSIPRTANFKVIGIFEIGMYEYDSSVVYIPMDFAQKFFMVGDKITQIEVILDNYKHTDKTKTAIKMSLPTKQYSVLSWKDSNARFFDSLDTERVAMFIILSMIIIVAVFNVTTLLYMLVQDKRSEIAILKSMGAKSKDILKAFILTGLRLSIKGTMLGIILGFAFLYNMEKIRSALQWLFHIKIFDASVYFLNNIPFKIGDEIIYIIAMSIFLSIIASLMPAIKASRENPAKILSNE